MRPTFPRETSWPTLLDRTTAGVELKSIAILDLIAALLPYSATMRTPIILASASPRRRELLSEMRIPFLVLPSDVDETPHPGETPEAMVQRLARRKAMKAVASQRAAVVLAADTIVVLDGSILGKPDSRDHARSMLQQLSGREHRVLTGFCVLAPGGELVEDVVSTQVRFRALADSEIDTYLDGDEAYDKAGAYAIQGGAAGFVESIVGSYSNVVGLPQDEVAAALGRFVSLPDRNQMSPA